MLNIGKCITKQDDILVKTPIENIYHLIKNPNPELESKIRQLNIIRGLDPKRYSFLKKELPYIVCGTFNPPYRRTENFGYTQYFIVDIDHITSKGLIINDIKNSLKLDPRVMLIFTSPSKDGLKILFKFKERCYDSGIYKTFYKLFVQKFSNEYNLSQVIDTRTCDVCRACFLSIDNNVYYNKTPIEIDINQYVNFNNPQEVKDELINITKEQSKLDLQIIEQNVDTSKDPDDESINKIKEILKLRQKKEVGAKEVYVPDRLNDIINDLVKYIEETGISVTEVININYAKKIRMRLGQKSAEINLFYGKRGFTVVESPKVGTNAELNGLTAELINGYISNL